MMMRSMGLVSLAFLALAGCSHGGDDPAAQSGGWSIAAGRYSNLTTSEKVTLDLMLPQGDQGKVASIRVCDPDCADYDDLAMMRGLNGVSFSLTHRGKSVDVTVTPASPSAVDVNAAWGDGLTQTRLERKP
jgi:hypothetical protein